MKKKRVPRALAGSLLLLFLAFTPQTAVAQHQVLGLQDSAVFVKSAVATFQMKFGGGKPVFPKSNDREPRYIRTVVATAYSSDPNQTDSTPCTPAMGSFNLCENYEQFGTEDAIANNCLRLGTVVRFPELFGDRDFVVRDRMNSRYDCHRVDFWVGSVTPETQEIIQAAKAEAKAFGVKRLEMEVYGRG